MIFKNALCCTLFSMAILIAAAGCSSTAAKSGSTGPEPETVPLAHILLGPLEYPSHAREAAVAWKEAAANNDTLWMKGLEGRYAYPLFHLSFSHALGEQTSITEDWSDRTRDLLVSRTGIQIGPALIEKLAEWKAPYLEGDRQATLDLPSDWETDSKTEEWIAGRVRALSLFQAGRYQEAANTLKDSERFEPVLRRIDHLMQVECLRRAGLVDEARGEWSKLADEVILRRDESLSGPVLDAGHPLENLSDERLDGGRLVSLAEMAEGCGDVPRAWKAYQDLWSDPRLPKAPEVLATQSSILRRAGLGTLRIVAGSSSAGDHSSRLIRWLDMLEGQPKTVGLLSCKCELRRIETAVNLRQNRLAFALSNAMEAARLADQTGDPVLIAKAKDELAVVQAHCGEVEKALQNSEEAARAADASGDAYLQYEVMRNRLIFLTGKVELLS